MDGWEWWAVWGPYVPVHAVGTAVWASESKGTRLRVVWAIGLRLVSSSGASLTSTLLAVLRLGLWAVSCYLSRRLLV
jgi:hypothetical protein